MEKTTVRGTVERIVFRNEENGYAVLSVKEKGKEITLVGTFPSISEGISIEAEGQMVSHAAYGNQFKVTTYTEVIPEGKEAIERYLGSGAIKGIGAALAARIVKRFGDETLKILEEEPERFAEVKGISARKAREIASQVDGQRNMRRAMIFLQNYGITLAMSVKAGGGHRGNRLQNCGRNCREGRHCRRFRIPDLQRHPALPRPRRQRRERVFAGKRTPFDGCGYAWAGRRLDPRPD